jgi:uncharacterized protein YjbJ (UPF0337 family)
MFVRRLFAPTRYPDMKDQIRGKAEELKGKVTGDRGEEMKGKARQAVGNVKKDVRDVRDDVRDEMNRNRMRNAENPEAEPGPDGDRDSR